MDLTFRQRAHTAINSVLGIADLGLIRRGSRFEDYIPFEDTLSSALKAGLSVGDYIDATYNVPGATQQTIDQLTALGVFSQRIEHVCEIGLGSGRYLEKTLQICHPCSHEIYETSRKWRDWLAQQYNVIVRATDGRSLASTPSCSIDLVQAHKVFPGLPVLTICRYFLEMARVVRVDGKIVFDILTEATLNDVLLERWLASEAQYPCSLVAEGFAINFFRKRGVSFLGNFYIPIEPGVTEYLVFSRSPS
jgi:hypothetical protein